MTYFIYYFSKCFLRIYLLPGTLWSYENSNEKKKGSRGLGILFLVSETWRRMINRIFQSLTRFGYLSPLNLMLKCDPRGWGWGLVGGIWVMGPGPSWMALCAFHGSKWVLAPLVLLRAGCLMESHICPWIGIQAKETVGVKIARRLAWSERRIRKTKVDGPPKFLNKIYLMENSGLKSSGSIKMVRLK